MFEKFFGEFDEAMSAAAFAEAGEFDTARQIIGEGKNSNKKVLLGTAGTEVDHKAFRYAFNFCRRVGARLEILHIIRPSDTGRGLGLGLKDVLSEIKTKMMPVFRKLEKEGVGYRLNFGEGSIEEEVARYALERRDILLVVIESPDEAKTRKGEIEKRMQGALEMLKCPLVVVSDALKA